MGCCFSTPKNRPQHSNQLGHLRLISPTMTDRAPPVAEEDTVKEVLSEIPVVQKKLQNLKVGETDKVVVEEEKLVVKGIVEKVEEVEVSEVSQASEMYSMNDSLSTATTVTENREDEVVSKFSSQRVKRSPAKVPGKRPYAGEIAGGTEQRAKAMAKRMPVGPMPVRGRESGSVRLMQGNVGSPGVKRVSEENPGRRLRSPATRTAGGGVRGAAVYNSPMKRSGTAGGRSAEMGTESSERGKKVQERSDTALEGKELYAHVSLECFIFL